MFLCAENKKNIQSTILQLPLGIVQRMLHKFLNTILLNSQRITLLNVFLYA